MTRLEEDRRPRGGAMNRAPQIVCDVPNCIDVMTRAVMISDTDATTLLRALIRAGYIIAPAEPTNSMFEAYISALNHSATKPATLIANVGKARKRWKAMAQAGLKVVFSIDRHTGREL